MADKKLSMPELGQTTGSKPLKGVFPSSDFESEDEMDLDDDDILLSSSFDSDESNDTEDDTAVGESLPASAAAQDEPLPSFRSCPLLTGEEVIDVDDDNDDDEHEEIEDEDCSDADDSDNSSQYTDVEDDNDDILPSITSSDEDEDAADTILKNPLLLGLNQGSNKILSGNGLDAVAAVLQTTMDMTEVGYTAENTEIEEGGAFASRTTSQKPSTSKATLMNRKKVQYQLDTGSSSSSDCESDDPETRRKLEQLEQSMLHEERSKEDDEVRPPLRSKGNRTIEKDNEALSADKAMWNNMREDIRIMEERLPVTQALLKFLRDFPQHAKEHEKEWYSSMEVPLKKVKAKTSKPANNNNTTAAAAAASSLKTDTEKKQRENAASSNALSETLRRKTPEKRDLSTDPCYEFARKCQLTREEYEEVLRSLEHLNDSPKKQSSPNKCKKDNKVTDTDSTQDHPSPSSASCESVPFKNKSDQDFFGIHFELVGGVNQIPEDSIESVNQPDLDFKLNDNMDKENKASSATEAKHHVPNPDNSITAARMDIVLNDLNTHSTTQVDDGDDQYGDLMIVEWNELEDSEI